eukprot:COSAG03_NODE_5236_length_1303_cov_1.232558_1_plen_36_part_10
MTGTPGWTHPILFEIRYSRTLHEYRHLRANFTYDMN